MGAGGINHDTSSVVSNAPSDLNIVRGGNGPGAGDAALRSGPCLLGVGSGVRTRIVLKAVVSSHGVEVASTAGHDNLANDTALTEGKVKLEIATLVHLHGGISGEFEVGLAGAARLKKVRPAVGALEPLALVAEVIDLAEANLLAHFAVLDLAAITEDPGGVGAVEGSAVGVTNALAGTAAGLIRGGLVHGEVKDELIALTEVTAVIVSTEGLVSVDVAADAIT
mmetsp:Transcript_22727/g.44594  ORF Transcript_22727/g.44594 Transcript_22727/m.44594 type:complete len:224 (-) Transcript_22727:380-1051(-)